MTYYIRCRVSGGVTGTREALLKRDGRVQTFASREDASNEAVRLQREMNSPSATATFQYWVEEGL